MEVTAKKARFFQVLRVVLMIAAVIGMVATAAPARASQAWKDISKPFTSVLRLDPSSSQSMDVVIPAAVIENNATIELEVWSEFGKGGNLRILVNNGRSYRVYQKHQKVALKTKNLQPGQNTFRFFCKYLMTDSSWSVILYPEPLFVNRMQFNIANWPGRQAGPVEAAPTGRPAATPRPAPSASPPATKAPAPATKARKDAAYYYQQGNASFDAEDYQQAVNFYLKAIELEENFAPLYYNLAMAQMATGDNPAARRNFEHYLKLRPDAENAAEVRRIIKSLPR